MHLVLLSGGSGRRLRPLSNDVRSKQFIKLFPGETGEYEFMAQRMYRQIRKHSVHPGSNSLRTLICIEGNGVISYKNMDELQISQRDTFFIPAETSGIEI